MEKLNVADRFWEAPYPATAGEVLRRLHSLCKIPKSIDDEPGPPQDKTTQEASDGITPSRLSTRDSTPKRRSVIKELPIFASDDAIAKWLIGAGKADEWRQIAVILETRGLPRVDALMGGRYTPAVMAFFDREYGLNEIVPRVSASGPENLGSWNRRCPRTKR